MGTYSIKEIEHLSGVKAHTIRIWEQRYAILNPKRTDTNIRYYTDVDLKLVLNIALLNRHGYRIGNIAKMSGSEIGIAVNSLSTSELKYEFQINGLTRAMIEIDEAGFEKIMSTCILHYGFQDTMLKIIYPFLEKIGIMWITGSINPAQEHFMTNLIRQKIIVAIDGQVVRINKNSKRYLLYLPEGELHELSLLFLSYLLKCRNQKVIYLGANVPLKDVLMVGECMNVDYIHSIFTSSPNNKNMKKHVHELSKKFLDQTILLSGYRSQNIKFPLPENVLIFSNMKAVLAYIDAI